MNPSGAFVPRGPLRQSTSLPRDSALMLVRTRFTPGASGIPSDHIGTAPPTK